MPSILEGQKMSNQQKTAVVPIAPLAVRADQAAMLLGIGRTSLHHLMKSGKIPYTKVERIVLFRLKDLENLLKPQARIYSDSEAFDVVINTLKRMKNNV